MSKEAELRRGRYEGEAWVRARAKREARTKARAKREARTKDEGGGRGKEESARGDVEQEVATRMHASSNTPPSP